MLTIGVLNERGHLGTENRVALIPEGISELLKQAPGTKFLVEFDAGSGSSIYNEQYEAVGAKIVSRKEVIDNSKLITAVKGVGAEEALASNAKYVRFLHGAAISPAIGKRMLESGSTFITMDQPLLIRGGLIAPAGLIQMSKVAGKYSVIWTMPRLDKSDSVLILGGGTAGTEAYETLIENGFQRQNIHIGDINDSVRSKFRDSNYFNTKNTDSLKFAVGASKLTIGAAVVLGKEAPLVLKDEYWNDAPEDACAVDIAIDQQGCTEEGRRLFQAKTISEGIKDWKEWGKGSILCPPNMPGFVPQISTPLYSEAMVRSLPLMVNLETGELHKKQASTAILAHQGKATDGAFASQIGVEHSPLQ